MKDKVISKGGPTIFQQIVVPFVAASMIVIAILQVGNYFFQKDLITKELKTRCSDSLSAAAAYFDATYALPIQDDLKFIQNAYAFDFFLSSPKNEILLTKPLAEKLFLHFTKRDKGIYLSMRFINAAGVEKIVTEGNKRKKNYVSLATAPKDALYDGISALFSKLISKKPGTILYRNPFQYQGKWTFLAGMVKSEPETGGTAGVVIFHCDLTEYFTYLAEYHFSGERVATAISLDHQSMFSSIGKDIAPCCRRGPLGKQECRHFIDLSKTIKINPNNHALFRVVFKASFQVFQKETKNVLIYSSLFLFLAVLFIGVVVWIVSKIFSRPLTILIHSIQQFARGDLSVRVHAKTTGEIQMLSETFNQMAEDLDKTTVLRDPLIKEVAERKRAEENLERLSQKNELILNSAAEGILGLDLQGKHTFVNPAAAKMLGYKAEELLGRLGHSLWHHTKPDGNPCSVEECQIHKTFLTGMAHSSFDEVFWRKDGTSFPVEYASTPLYEQGRLSGAVVVFSDITRLKNEQMLLEHEYDIQEMISRLLKASLEENSLEDYLRHALDLILGVPWFSLESRGAIFLAGEDPATLVMKAQKGLSDFIQKSCRLLPFGKCHCGKAALTKKIEFANAVTERHEIHCEGMIPHGHYCVPILFGEKVVGVLNTYVRENYKNDERTEQFLWIITNALAGAIEQKKTKEALRKAHNELEERVRERTMELEKMQEYAQKILATITDYIYTVAVRDGVAVATIHRPTCLAVTGYTVEEFKDRSDLWENMVHEEDRPAVLRFSAAVLTGKNIPPLEHRIRRKDGEIRWVRNTPVFHRDPSGRMTSYDGIIRDITERKHAEISLIESMEKVARASKAKDQFLANMSHEVRTPLNGIIGFSDLLEGTSLDPVQRGYVEMLRDGGEMLLALVTDVLDFSKMVSGEMRLEKINFDLERLIQGVIKIHVARLKKKDPRIFCTLDEKVPHGFFGDPAKIRLVLMHFLSNAIKFTEKGEIEVRVTLDGNMEKRDGGCETRVRIAVRDTGIGLSPDKYKTIFDAFEQADTSTTRKYGGAGLGLSISKGLVDLMGGTIEVESEPGKGSVFSLVLPLKAEPAMKGVQIFPVKDEALEGKRILILDNDKITREIFTRYCEEAKMAVSCSASSAQDAFKWLSGQSSLPDIFLTEIVMSNLNGYEVAEKIRKDKRYENMKLVAVTGDAREGSAFKAQQSGFDAYLTKPASRENLIKVIKTVLGDKREKILPVEIVTQYTAEELTCKGLNILMVEDNPASQELLSIILKNFEFDVGIASHGREAVEKVKENSYDLILMDLQMPVMGGVEATRIIREQLHKTMPILALTAGISDDDKEHCLAAGMNDYLLKPIEIDKLRDKIFHWIKGVSQDKPVSRKEESGIKWDKQKAMKELGIPEELYLELVDGFIKQSATAIQDLEKFFQDRNFDGVAKAAHFIKGAAGNLRIEEIHATTKELEAAAKGDQNISTIEKQIGILKSAMEELKNNI